MSILEIIELIVIAIILLFLLIYYGIKAIKNHWVDELVMTINDAIKFIEKQSMKGYEKKQYVLDFLASKGIKIDTESLEAIIESAVQELK